MTEQAAGVGDPAPAATADAVLPGAVIFDCDGVLVASEPVSCRVASAVLGRYGVEMTLEACHEAFTGAAGDMRATVEALTGRVLPIDFVDAYVAELLARYELELEASPGAVALIEQLVGRGIPHAVASNGTRRTTLGALDAADLTAWFGGTVFTSDDVAHGKPEPDLFLLAAARLGVAPERCLVLEDSPVGIAAARAAGMTVWALVGTYRDASLTDADRVFGSLAEMAAALGLAEAPDPAARPEGRR